MPAAMRGRAPRKPAPNPPHNGWPDLVTKELCSAYDKAFQCLHHLNDLIVHMRQPDHPTPPPDELKLLAFKAGKALGLPWDKERKRFDLPPDAVAFFEQIKPKR